MTQRPDVARGVFARTNVQTITQRVALVRELLPGTMHIAELCCGDFQQQADLYQMHLGVKRVVGLDIDPQIVALNQSHGLECMQGDVLAAHSVAQLADFDLLFFGPPLSKNCDGHHLLSFTAVSPSYESFVTAWVGEGAYRGAITCICPRTTTMGDIQQLHHRLRPFGYGLRLIHHSYATLTGRDERTPLRLKYIELWFARTLPDLWEIRESKTAAAPPG